MKLVMTVILLALVGSAGVIKHNRGKKNPASSDKASRANVVRELCAQNIIDKGGDNAAVIKDCGPE